MKTFESLQNWIWEKELPLLPYNEGYSDGKKPIFSLCSEGTGYQKVFQGDYMQCLAFLQGYKNGIGREMNNAK